MRRLRGRRKLKAPAEMFLNFQRMKKRKGSISVSRRNAIRLGELLFLEFPIRIANFS